VLIEFGADYWIAATREFWCFSAQLERGKRGSFLLNNRLQMSGSSATEELVTLTKQTKIGPCEQVRVN
jgi:hypothetical protein